MVAEGSRQGAGRQRKSQKSVNGKAVFASASSDSLLSKEDRLTLTIYLQGIGFCQNVWASILIKVLLKNSLDLNSSRLMIFNMFLFVLFKKPLSVEFHFNKPVWGLLVLSNGITP